MIKDKIARDHVRTAREQMHQTVIHFSYGISMSNI